MDQTPSNNSVSGSARRLWRWSRTSGTQPRLLLAGKAAAAGAIAWLLAQHVPGVAADYPYYAPLGAVVAMQSTVFSGLRSGLQTLLGILVGIGVAALTMIVGVPGIVAVAVAVGIGVVIGGFRVLGEGGSWAPTAAVLVLLVGGSHAEGYSFAYVLQMALGVAVGLLVNFVVFPPLRFWDAELRIGEVRGVLADHLDALADVLGVDADTRTDDDLRAWDRQQQRLDSALADVRERVRAAEESRRFNPRGMRSSRQRLLQDAARFRALERAVWYTTDLTELVARSGPVADREGRPDRAFAEPLASAFRQVACVIRGDCETDEADDALRDLDDAIDAPGMQPSSVKVTASALVGLRGVVESERRATADA
jgi:uncharacterized membrane protein YgaE (UPF0421/DUF939 family)